MNDKSATKTSVAPAALSAASTAAASAAPSASTGAASRANSKPPASPSVPPTKSAPPDNGATGDRNPRQTFSDPLQAVRHDPADTSAWDLIDEAARSKDSPDEAEAVYQEILGKNDLPADVRRIVGQRAVEFLEEWYDDTEKPIAILRHCVSKDASNSWALEKLSLLLTLAKRWDDLLGTYDGALASVETAAQRVHLLEEAARIAKDFAGQAGRASDYLKQLFLLKPEDGALAASLERRLEQQERFKDLVDVWRARQTAVDGATATDLQLQIARTLLQPLGDAPGALDSARPLLEDARVEEQACELVERLASLEFTPHETQREALSLLKRKYAIAERTVDTIRILQKALAIATAPAEQAELYAELVSWLEVLGDLAQAQDTAGRWLVTHPDSKAAADKLQSLAELTKDYDGWATALVRAAERATSAEVRVPLLLQAARVYRDLADVPHSATELYGRVLLDESAARTAQLQSAQKLRELLISPAQLAQRLDVLERLSLLEPEAAEQIDALTEGARLSEQQGDHDRALRLWSECLARDPAYKLALDNRVRILSRCERWPELLQATQARTRYPADDVECRADWVSIAGLYAVHLSDPTSAIETWHHIEKTFGRNPQTVDALSELFARTERWTESKDLLRQAAAEDQPLPRRTELLARLGDVLRLHLGLPEQALARYQEGLGLDPKSVACRAGVAELLDNPLVSEAAAECLAEAYRSAEQWPELLALLETRLERASHATSKQAILAEAARISELHSSDLGQALQHVGRAFSIAPAPALEEELLRLADVTNDWGAAVSGYQRALRHLEDPERTTELLMEQGRLLEVKLGDWPEALSAYRRVVELDRTHLAGARAVIRSAGQVARWADAAWGLITATKARANLEPELVEAWELTSSERAAWTESLSELETALRATRDLPAALSHDLKFRLAIWHHEQRRDASVAEVLLKEAVAEHRAVDSLQLLIDIQRVNPSRDLVTSLLQLSELLTDPLLQLDEAAHVALEVVGDPELARPILTQSLQVAEQQMRAADKGGVRDVARYCVDQLVAIAQARGDHAEAFRLLTHAAQAPFEAEQVWTLKHRAATVATTELGQHATAIALCEDVLAEQPDRAQTIALLAGLYEQQGKLAPLVKLLKSELELPRNLEQRLHTRLQLARVLALQSSPLLEQVFVLTENLEEQPGHAASIEVLEGVLLRGERARDLYTVLCEQADLVNARGEGENAAALYARAGQLALHDLRDDRAALSALQSSVSLCPTCPVLDSLASICTARGEHDQAVMWLKQRLSLTPKDDTEAQRTTHVALAEALRASGASEEAVSVLQRGLERDPAATAVRALLITLQEQRQDWVELAGLLAEGAPHLDDTDARVSYLSRAAEVHWRRLQQVTLAVPLLQQAVELSPLDRTLRLWLAEASRLDGQLDAAKELLSGLLEEFGRRRTPERAQVHFQMALIERAQGQLGAALEHLDAASNIQRGDALILRTLGDVARENGELERAETAYRALLLLVGRGVAGEQPSAAQGESSILYELYKIAAQKQDQERARDLLDSAIEKSEHPQEAALLEQTLREAGEWELLHQALQRRQARGGSSQDQLALLRGRAESLRHLGRHAEALELELDLLAQDPTDESTLARAEQLATECQMLDRFKQAVVDLAEKHEAEQPALSCRLWLFLGNDAEQRGDLNLAATYYERAQLTAAEPERTFQALKRMHEHTGDIHGLTLALERFVAQAEGSSSPHLAEATYRLAEIELCSLAGRERGVDRLAQALALAEQPERALHILQTALEVVAPTGAMLTQLEQLARRAGNDEALLLALYHLGLGEDSSLPELREACALAAQLNDAEKHERLLARAVEVARQQDQLPQAVWALTELATRKEERQQWAEAEELLQDAVRAAPKKEKYELQLRLAQLLDRLGNLSSAATWYERLAKAAPEDSRIWSPLINIYRRTKETEKLTACLSRAEQHVTEESARRGLRLERIRLLIEDGRHEEAEQALRQTLEDSPEDPTAADLLLELLERQQRSLEAQGLLAQCLSSAIDRRDDANVVRYALQLGELFEIQGDMDDALSAYRQGQAAVRNSRPLIAAVLRLLPDTELDERANLLESLIPAEPTDKVEALATQLAQLRADLHDESGQERALELGFRADPKSSLIRERLEAWYRQRDHWVPLAELIATDAAHRDSVEEAIRRYLEAATLFDERLSDAHAAGDVLLRALPLAPHSLSLLEPLTQYLTTSGRADVALQVLTAALEEGEPARAERGALLRLRAIARERSEPASLTATMDAISDLQDALAEGQLGCEELHVELLERQRSLSASAGNDEMERDAILKLGQRLPELGRQDEATEILGAWVERHPDDLAVVERFADLAFDSANWDAASRALLGLYRATAGDARIAAGLRYAEAEERRGTPMEAREVLERLYVEAPGNEQLAQRLRQMYEAAGERLQLAQMLLDNATKTTDPEHRYRLLTDSGELFVATGEPHVEGVRALEEALRLKPMDHRATLALAQALTLHGEIEAACNVLGEVIKLHGKRRTPQLAELQYGMAKIAQIAGDEEGRFAWLDAALQSDRKNGVVASEMALFCMERADYDNALKALQLVTLMKEDAPMGRGEAYLRQAHIAELRGDPRKAALLAKRALTAEPDYQPAKLFLDRLGIA